MKSLFTFYFLLLQLFSSAQTKPTKAEINKAKQSQSQMQTDMEEELKEMEKDDPEMAKKVRKIMKQQGKQVKQTTATQPPKFISPITAIPVKQPVIPPTEAQATDKLLWYKGKKINENSLVTTGGTIVYYNRKKNEVVVQPDVKKDPFKKMVDELKNTEKRKSELINNIAPKKNSFYYYPAIINTLKEYDRVSENYSGVLKNTIQLPQPITEQSTDKPTKADNVSHTPKQNTIKKEIPQTVKNAHDQAMEMMKNYPSIDFPAPPENDFSLCSTCDTSVANTYQRQSDQWKKEFNGYERNLTDKAISVIQALSVPQLEEVPEAVQMMADMEKVTEFAMNRFRNKVDLLIRKYEKDFARLANVAQMAIAYERQKQLLGASEENSGEAMLKIISMLDGFEPHLQKQMEEKNYNVVLNMAFVLGMERQKQLLGASEENPASYYDKVVAFNRFKMSIDMDANVSSEDRIADAGAITTKDVYVSLGMNKCRFVFSLLSADFRTGKEEDFRLPMTAKGGIKKQKEEDDKWVSYNYSGPKDILGLFPPFSISFCDDAKDSVFMQPPIPKPEDMANVTPNSVLKAYTIEHTGVLAGLFLKGTDEAAEEGEVLAMQTIATYSTDHLETPTGNAKLDKLQSEYNLAEKTKELQNKMSAAINQNSVLILFDAQNKNKVIVDAEASPSHTVAGSEMEVKGKIKIKVVHDPAAQQ